MHKIKFQGKFFKSLNFRIMLFLLLMGTVPALIIGGVFLMSYERQAMAQLSNDVKNQCQILSTQLRDGENLLKTEDEVLQGELTQLASLYDGRIIIIDQNFQIIEDTSQLEEGRTMVAEEVVRCFKGENTSHYVSGRFIEMTVPIIVENKDTKTVIGVILASASTDAIHAQMEGLTASVQMWIVVVIICALALSIILANWLVRPLQHMNRSIEGLVEGSLDGDLDIHDCTETENISDTFNLMLAKLRLVEESRQEFVSNVSHELKTPLALIQGYAEGLQECINDDAESREFYCEVIIDEADKMNRMVKKLLTLNQLEFGNDQVIMERFDMTELIRGVANSTRILMEQKGIRLELENSEEAWVWGDEFKVEEVITNYMSNAINHADGEKLIRVFYTRSEDKLRVSVFNTGQPIPEEDIEKIWVKFYKVDKARTREYGGSGIGLSIVKAIMDSFHQRCGVINHEDGVEFWMELATK